MYLILCDGSRTERRSRSRLLVVSPPVWFLRLRGDGRDGSTSRTCSSADPTRTGTATAI